MFTGREHTGIVDVQRREQTPLAHKKIQYIPCIGTYQYVYHEICIDIYQYIYTMAYTFMYINVYTIWYISSFIAMVYTELYLNGLLHCHSWNIASYWYWRISQKCIDISSSESRQVVTQVLL
jgi:hypothetical protein